MAMGISVELVGMSEWIADLSQLEMRVWDEAEVAVTEATWDAYDASFPLIPQRTGYLASRQQVRSGVGGGSEIMTELYNDAPYALFVCYGHHTRSGSWVPARDFMTGPLLVGQQSLQRRLIAIIG